MVVNGCRLAPTREHGTPTILVTASRPDDATTRNHAENPLLVAAEFQLLVALLELDQGSSMLIERMLYADWTRDCTGGTQARTMIL